MATEVICLSDSRGRGLSDLLKESDLPITVSDRCTPGATLSLLLTKLESWGKRCDSKIAILSGGICDFTMRIRGYGKQEVVYCTDEHLRHQKVSTVKLAIDKYFNICANKGIKPIITNIYPVDLKKSKEWHKARKLLNHSSISDEETILQQACLEEDIKSANSYIADKAQQFMACRYVNLVRSFTKSTAKKTGRVKKNVKRLSRVSLAPLVDGVHPDQVMKDALFAKILKATSLALDASVDSQESN